MEVSQHWHTLVIFCFPAVMMKRSEGGAFQVSNTEYVSCSYAQVAIILDKKIADAQTEKKEEPEMTEEEERELAEMMK